MLKDTILADETILLIYKNTKDKRVIILDKNYVKQTILEKLPETLLLFIQEKLIILGVEAVRKDFRNFENKKNLPEAWAGLRDEELQSNRRQRRNLLP